MLAMLSLIIFTLPLWMRGQKSGKVTIPRPEFAQKILHALDNEHKREWELEGIPFTVNVRLKGGDMILLAIARVLI